MSCSGEEGLDVVCYFCQEFAGEDEGGKSKYNSLLLRIVIYLLKRYKNEILGVLVGLIAAYNWLNT
jgi:hypothetical protein